MTSYPSWGPSQVMAQGLEPPSCRGKSVFVLSLGIVCKVISDFAILLKNGDHAHARVCVCWLCVCLSVTSHISETSWAIAIRFDTVTVSVTRMHHVFIILTLIFIQGHTDLNHENNKCLIISSNAHQVCCEHRPTKGLYDQCQSDDLDLHSRSLVRLKLNYLICNILDNISAITFKLGLIVDLWVPYICSCSFWWTWPWCRVTVDQQRKNNNQRWMLLATKQAIGNLLQR